MLSMNLIALRLAQFTKVKQNAIIIAICTLRLVLDLAQNIQRNCLLLCEPLKTDDGFRLALK